MPRATFKVDGQFKVRLSKIGPLLVFSVFVTWAGCELAPGSVPEDVAIPTVASNQEVVQGRDGASTPTDEARDPNHVIRVEWLGGFVPDPAAVSDRFSAVFLSEIYEGLTRFRGGDGLEVEPALAASYTVEEGGLAFEFRLRPGLTFSNGDPVTADDFKWSWERSLSPRFAEGRARDVLGQVRGADAILDGEKRELAGVTIVDERTLQVELVSQVPDFPRLLAEPVATVLQRENVEGWGFDWSSWQNPEPSHIRPWYFDDLPVGTGPFALADFDFWEDRAVLVRNEHYWDRSPTLDRIELAMEDTPFELRNPVLALSDRQFDLMFEIGASSATAEATADGLLVQIRMPVAPVLDLLILDPRSEGTSSAPLRRALAATVMREPTPGTGGWFEAGQFGAVRWQEAGRILPPGLLDALPKDAEAPPSYAIDGRNEVGSFGAVRLEFFDETGSPPETLTDRIGQWLPELEVDLVPINDGAYAGWNLPPRRLVSVRRVHVVPPVADPYGYFSEIVGILGADNESSEVLKARELLSSAVSETDESARIAMYADVESHLIQSALVIPLYVSSDHAESLSQPWLTWIETPANPGSRFKGISVDTGHPEFRPLY